MRGADRGAIVDAWLDGLPKLGTALPLRPHLDVVLGAVLEGDLDGATGALDQIVRLHAIHDLTASQSVSFLLCLKTLLSGETGRQATVPPGVAERIDRLVMVAFDLYVRCREQLWEIKWHQHGRRTWLFDRLSSPEDRTPSPPAPRHVARRS